MKTQAPCLVSACLLGLCTRYDGRCKKNGACLDALAGRPYLPICPEQLGDLPTPRPAASILGGNGHDVLAARARVLDIHGRDLSAAFIRGARMTLALARMQRIELALLKADSPSCGSEAPGIGVAAALLAQAGIRIISF